MRQNTQFFFFSRRQLRAPVFSVVLLGFLLTSKGVVADEGNYWAILIGAQNYYKAPNLLYVLNDVQQISATLQQRGNYAPSRVLEMTDTGANERFQPLRDSILKEVPRWLGKLGERDRVIVYFTGHGYRSPDGRLFLAPLDIDPAAPETTGVSITWLRDELENCKAQVKLLIIDACHAGAEKAVGGPAPVTAQDLVQPFDNVAGVVTLASCSAEEYSHVWPAVEQSLFSYWLNLGLRGHADADGDCDVDIHEIYEYVHENTSTIAPVVFKRSQTPVRNVGPRVPGVPTVIRPKPMTLKATLQEMAEQLAVEAQRKHLSGIGVPAFTANIADAAIADMLGGEYGLMPRYCADELSSRLKRELDRRDKSLDVIPHEALHKALTDDGIAPSDLQTSAIRSISVDGTDLRATALGQFCVRTGRIITLQCLLKGRGNVDMGRVGGTALLTESEWAMLGKNGELVTEVPPSPQGPTIDNPVPPEASIGIGVETLERSSLRNHDPDLPYEVHVTVGGRKQPSLFVDDAEYVALSKGDIYKVRVEHRKEHDVFLRLLVDGLNTLPEKALVEKGARIESTKKVWLPAQRVNLLEARAWPLPSKGPTSAYTVPGFFSKTGDDGEYQEFRVVDGNESFAADQQFTEQIGLITAAFYAPAAKQRGGTRGDDGPLGTAGGEFYDIQMDTYPGNEVPGDLVATINIHYVSPTEFERLKRSEAGN